ncbi:MAG: acyltransferase [Rhodocyclaceae bacterium]|nr:MAG: acyltransferase [Rhodocyclaceae bacterium]
MTEIDSDSRADRYDENLKQRYSFTKVWSRLKNPIAQNANWLGAGYPRSSRIAALTGLRFFAASAIVLYHLPGQLGLPIGAFAGIPLNQGVSFFYVLSGFILQHSYRQRLGLERRITTTQFIALRFFRLWPCHIAVIALLIAIGGKSILDYFLQTFSTGQLFAAIFLF